VLSLARSNMGSHLHGQREERRKEVRSALENRFLAKKDIIPLFTSTLTTTIHSSICISQHTSRV
jgi:hypothetical protein